MRMASAGFSGSAFLTGRMPAALSSRTTLSPTTAVSLGSTSKHVLGSDRGTGLTGVSCFSLQALRAGPALRRAHRAGLHGQVPQGECGA